MNKKAFKLIALTGGPGAGKTTVLDLIKPQLPLNVTILPEAAGMVFGGGFWRVNTPEGKIAAQKVIFETQTQMEYLAMIDPKLEYGLCDRGTLDGLAYWPNSKENFFETFNTNLESQYAKYEAVIHLRSPGLRNGYNHENPLRLESVDEATKLDAKLYEVWSKHPKYFTVDSTDSFQEKVDLALDIIKRLIPNCNC